MCCLHVHVCAHSRVCMCACVDSSPVHNIYVCMYALHVCFLNVRLGTLDFSLVATYQCILCVFVLRARVCVCVTRVRVFVLTSAHVCAHAGLCEDACSYCLFARIQV